MTLLKQPIIEVFKKIKPAIIKKKNNGSSLIRPTRAAKFFFHVKATKQDFNELVEVDLQKKKIKIIKMSKNKMTKTEEKKKL